jgi:DNA-binding MarR family transcriptional regulator
VAVRQRDAVLAAVELLRQHIPECNMRQLLAFLYISENEGLNVTELAALLGTTRATSSRTASSLEGGGRNHASLIVSRPGELTAQSRSLSLSKQGRAVRERLDAIITTGVTIAQPAER